MSYNLKQLAELYCKVDLQELIDVYESLDEKGYVVIGLDSLTCYQGKFYGNPFFGQINMSKIYPTIESCEMPTCDEILLRLPHNAARDLCLEYLKREMESRSQIVQHCG